MDIQEALNDKLWKEHAIGDLYSMSNVDGSVSHGWKVAYYPLFGTYVNGVWVDFNEPRILVERPFKGGGFDFREVPTRYLTKSVIVTDNS